MNKTIDYKPYEHILQAIIEGKEVQWESYGNWYDQDSKTTMKEITNAEFPPESYRIRPKTININGYEVPKPLKHLPSGEFVYCASITMPDLVEDIYIGKHCCLNISRLLDRKLLHSTKEAAIKHAEALLSLT